MSDHDQLDTWLRQSQKLSEEERSIMQDEPCDVIKNLELLTALRKASEAEAPGGRSNALSKSRKKRSDMDSSAADSPSASGADKSSRSKGGVPRSASVSSTQARESRGDGVAVKIEEGSEGTKGTVAERSGVLQVGAQVVFKHSKNKQGVEGEGIQCIIKNISGDGHKKRYSPLQLTKVFVELTIWPQMVRGPRPRAEREWRAGCCLQDHCFVSHSYPPDGLLDIYVYSRQTSPCQIPRHHHLLPCGGDGSEEGSIPPQV